MAATPCTFPPLKGQPHRHWKITNRTLTIDDATISGTPGQVTPTQLNGAIAVILTSDYAD